MYVFIGAMFGPVFSNNLIWLYFFWEVTSVCSFLLIGYTKTGEAINNCFKALWMNLLGGLGMAVGIVIFGINHGVTDLQSILTQDKSLIVLPVICLSFGALTKSAQLPFSKWLLGAMVAPTPSSALLHSATMVKAGVYLLIRLAPAMSGEFSGYMVGLVSGLTFLAMSMLAITAYDGKKVLAYSTLSNLGLITACAGIGTEETVWAAIFLVIFHAVSKSLLFQTVGSIEHQTGSRDIETMHCLVRRYPYLTWTLVVGIAGMFLAPLRSACSFQNGQHSRHLLIPVLQAAAHLKSSFPHFLCFAFASARQQRFSIGQNGLLPYFHQTLPTSAAKTPSRQISGLRSLLTQVL